MSVNTTGAEFKRFYADAAYWPEGRDAAYHDGTLFKVDGEEVSEDYDMSGVPDAAKVTIVDGVVFNAVGSTADTVNLDTYFKRWRKAQTTKVLVVEVEASKLEAVLAAIKAAGGSVLTGS